MATFTYKAIDTNGRQVADSVVAPDRAAAIDLLFTKSLNPISVERQEEYAAAGGRVAIEEDVALVRVEQAGD